MKRFRVTVGVLMAVVLIVAVFLAASREPSQLRASIAFTLTLVCLAFAAFLAVVRSGRGRAGWAGMAVFGFVSITWAVGGESGKYPHLARRPLLNTVAERLPGNAGRTAFYSSPRNGEPKSLNIRPGSLTYNTWRQFPATNFDLTAFHRIGHCLLAFQFGLVGAGLGRVANARDLGRGESPGDKQGATQ